MLCIVSHFAILYRNDSFIIYHLDPRENQLLRSDITASWTIIKVGNVTEDLSIEVRLTNH